MSRATLLMSQADYAADQLPHVSPAELSEAFSSTAAIPAVEVAAPAKKDPLAGHDHAELGVRTEKGSQPWCIDHVLLQNVGRPLTAEQISVLSGVNLKKVKIHLVYWSGVDQVIGENGWTLKRQNSGLCQRLRLVSGFAYLIPKE